MQIANADSWKVQPFGTAVRELREFDGDLVVPFHAIRQSLKYALICWHESRDPKSVIRRLRREATAYVKVYSSPRRLSGLRDDFEMHLAMAVALTNDLEAAALVRSKFSFRPCPNGYAYYAGFKQALLALMLDDKALGNRARQRLSQFNATKTFYFPAKAVIFAALDGELRKLKASVKAVSRKFDGYAKKCHAVRGQVIDVAALDHHWFSPYPDWAFFAQAIRRFGRIDAEDTFWMPMQFLNSFADG